MRACETCGKSLEGARRNKKFCCSACGDLSRYPPKPGKCKHCGEGFVGRNGQLYCSRECKTLARRVPQEPKTCAHCGEPFVGVSRRKFCSAECREFHHNGRSRNRGKDWIDGRKVLEWLEDRVGSEAIVQARRLDPGFSRRMSGWRRGESASIYSLDSYLVRHFFIYWWEIPEELYVKNQRVRSAA